MKARVEIRDMASGATEVQTICEIPIPDPQGNPFTIFKPFPTRIVFTDARYRDKTLYPEVARTIAAQFNIVAVDIDRYLKHARHLNAE